MKFLALNILGSATIVNETTINQWKSMNYQGSAYLKMLFFEPRA